MQHVYRLDEAATAIVATTADIARSTLARHAAEVDARGGKGQGPRAFAGVVEELAQACASTAMIYVMHVTAAQAVTASATLAGRDDVLRTIAAGRHLTTASAKLRRGSSGSRRRAVSSRCAA